MEGKELTSYMTRVVVTYLNMVTGELVLKTDGEIPKGLGGFWDGNEDRREFIAEKTDIYRQNFESLLKGISRKDLEAGLQDDLYKQERKKILHYYDCLLSE
jgi:hypothetical protein